MEETGIIIFASVSSQNLITSLDTATMPPWNAHGTSHSKFHCADLAQSWQTLEQVRPIQFTQNIWIETIYKERS